MRSGYVSVAHVDTDVNAYAEQPAADLAHLVLNNAVTEPGRRAVAREALAARLAAGHRLP